MSRVIDKLVNIGNERLSGKYFSDDRRDYLFEYFEGSNVVVSAHRDTICDYVNAVASVWGKNEPLYVGVNMLYDSVFGRLDNTIGVAIIDGLKEEFGNKLSYLKTNYEEVGGKGADKFCRDFKNILGDVLIVNFDISDDDYLNRKDGIGLVAYSYDTTPEFVVDMIKAREVEILKPRFNDSFVFEDYGIKTVSFHVQIEQMHGVVEYARVEKVIRAFDIIRDFVKELLDKTY